MVIGPACVECVRRPLITFASSLHGRCHLHNPLRVLQIIRSADVRHASGAAGAAPASAVHAPMADHHHLVREVSSLVPKLTAEMHKGSAGKVAVIGGCREYTGAPFFASFSALKLGADIAHVFCTQGAATVIKCYSPELIVHPYLPDSEGELDAEEERGVASAYFHGGSQVGTERQQHLRHRAVAAIEPWLDRFDAVVVGPGLGRNPLILATVADVVRSIRQRGIPIVVDADGLWLINQDLRLVQGYSNAILTPNVVEFQRLADKLGVDPGSDSALQEVAGRLGGPVVLRKGSADVISDGRVQLECDEPGSLRRAGGQGDVLSGCISVFAAWAQRIKGLGAEQLHAGESSLPPLMVAAYGGALVTRAAARRAFEQKRRAMGAVDVIAELGPTVDDLFDYSTSRRQPEV